MILLRNLGNASITRPQEFFLGKLLNDHVTFNQLKDNLPKQNDQKIDRIIEIMKTREDGNFFEAIFHEERSLLDYAMRLSDYATAHAIKIKENKYDKITI